MKSHALLLARFDIDFQTFVKLLPLLFEPHVVVSVYGEPKSAQPVFVGFELQDCLVGFERLVVFY